MIPKSELRKAIAAKCKDCIYDPIEPGTWRQQVEACTSPECPLYPVRPTPILRTRGEKNQEEPTNG